jgi:hypothetical protein
MSQTQVQEQGLALSGQKYDLSPDTVSSYAAEGRVGFGRYAVLGTDKNLQCKLPAAGELTLLAKRGVALQSHAMENIADGLAPGYEDKRPVSIMELGKVFVECEDAVSVDEAVLVRTAVDGGNDQLGIFHGTAGTGLEALPNARFVRASELVNGKHIAVVQLM